MVTAAILRSSEVLTTCGIGSKSTLRRMIQAGYFPAADETRSTFCRVANERHYRLVGEPEAARRDDASENA